MWIKKLKRRKIQSLVIAVILMLSTAIMIACVSFTMETNKFVNDYYGYEKSPLCFDIVQNKSAVDKLRDDKQFMSMVNRIETGDVSIINNELYKNGNSIDVDNIFVYSSDDFTSLDLTLPVKDGKTNLLPEDNEMWVCRIFANAYNLKIGDTLTIKDINDDIYNYKISEIVDSKKCSSGFLDNYSCYVNEHTYKNMIGNKLCCVNIYVNNESISPKTLSDAKPIDYAAMQLHSTDKSDLKMCLTILSRVFGGVGIAAAIIILAVSLIVIRYIVRSSIDKEYRLIGIYQSLGKSFNEIKKIYLATYVFPGCVGIIAGIFISRPLADYLSNVVLGWISGFSLTGITNIITIVISVLMLLILTVSIYLELKKIDKITPVEAMNTGIKSSRKKMKKSFIKNAHSSFSTGVNNLFKRTGKTVLVIVVLTVSFYTCLLSGSIGLSLSHYAEDKNIWENLPHYDGYIKIKDNENIKDYLEKSDYLSDYVVMNFDLNSVTMSFDNSDMTIVNANPMVYSDFKEERYTDVPFSKGRICKNPHEITVSEDFLNKVDKKVGEYLDITINNKKMTFLIVGCYSAMMKGGVSFYIREDDILEASPDYKSDTVLFFLKDKDRYDDFLNDFNSKFVASTMSKEFPFIEQEQKTVTGIAYPICIVLFFSFLAFSILNIVNVVYTTNKENRMKYGILKSMGFSTGYIFRQNFFELSVECLIAVIITLILHKFLSPLFFSLACGVYYIYDPVWLRITVCSSIFAIIMIISSLMLLSVRKISPVELMEE